MQTNLRIKNIVLAGTFHPDYFDRYLFVKNQIVSDEDIITDRSIFGGIGGILLSTASQSIAISYNQIVITDLVPESDNDIIYKTLVTIIKLASAGIHEISGMGMNFHWFLSDDTKGLAQITRDYFYNEKIEILPKFFSSNDAMFGIYASDNFKDARLKLDIKPNKITAPWEEDVIGFVFNFHFDIKNQSDFSAIINYVNDYAEYKTESEKIMLTYK